MPEIIKPREVELGPNAIIIWWDDGHRSPYPHRYLRLHCPCAHCVDELTGKRRLNPDTVPQDVKAVEYMPIGNYALQFLWSDAHYTGIYSFTGLRAACTCIACNEARARAQAGNGAPEPK